MNYRDAIELMHAGAGEAQARQRGELGYAVMAGALYATVLAASFWAALQLLAL